MDAALFDDDFSDLVSGWGTGQLAQGSLGYDDDSFVIEFAQAQASLWSRRSLGMSWDVLRISGSISIGSQADLAEGAAGWMCGTEAGDYVGGLVNSAGEWVFFSIEGEETTSLARGLLPELDPDGLYDVAVECAGTETGAMRLRMLVGDQEVGVFERAERGLPSFERAGLYAESADEAFTAIFDDAEATGGSTFGGFPGASPQPVSPYEELLYDLPSAFIEDCQPAPPEDPLVLAQATCIPAGQATQARFLRFGDAADRDSFFERLVFDAGPLPATGSCREGPFSDSFSIPSPSGEDGSYRLACYATMFDAGEEVQIVWTDPEVAIIGIGILQGEDFAALYDWWLTIGPAD